MHQCRARGKFRKQDIKPVVGDFVEFQKGNHDDGYLLKILERKNVLRRPPIANIDQALLVFSRKEPDFSTVLLDKFLLLIEHYHIKPIIVISKMDIEGDDSIYQYIQEYRNAGYTVIETSSKQNKGINEIKEIFKDQVTVITGQSGVGKSTLLNALDISLNLETNQISKALGRGKHTTRHVELMNLYDGYVADTPGFSSLELEMEPTEAARAYHDFDEYATACKFRGCLHDSEPHCAVKEAVDEGKISKEKIENGKADWLHYDVMDGHFVPNISFGYSILKDVSKVTNLFLDVHLMISEPQKYVDEFIKSGANLIVFHIETMENKEDTLALIHHIKENNVQVGISIKPNTPVDAIQDYLSLLDVVLVMSVEPGFGGQSFKEIALDKIKDLASRRKDNNYNYLIEVDGGINETTGKQCKEAGVDVLVAGSYVFNSEDCSQRIASLK